RPQISTARLLYCRMTPRASQMKVAMGSMSRMPSEARSIVDSVGEATRGVERALSFESSIRTPPRGPFAPLSQGNDGAGRRFVNRFRPLVGVAGAQTALSVAISAGLRPIQ